MAQARRQGLSSAVAISRLEAQVTRKLGADAIHLDVIAAELGAERVIEADPDHAGNLMQLRADLESGEWWHIALMHPGPLRELHARLDPGPSYRHGQLGDFGLPHAVLLVAVAPEGFLCLDPWLASQHQPLCLPWTFFPGAWTGRYLPVNVQP
jgi:hypothetical protein